jgi:hypothetical protein
VSGETESNISGWTTDTLREHLARQITDQREAFRQQVDDLRRMLDERYATQTKALDAAFKAAEQAVAVALANAEKATVKAETASERRFEGVNEFREQLQLIINTFMSRVETEARLIALSDRITANADRMGALELRLTSRLDRGDGADLGTAASRTEARLNSGQLIQGLILVVAVAAVIVAVVAILKK